MVRAARVMMAAFASRALARELQVRRDTSKFTGFLDLKVPPQTRRELVGPSNPLWRRTNDPMRSLALSSETHRRTVRLWLLAVAALMFATVVVGGATRLTESGLSIVEWKPVTGVMPPLDAPAWQAEFDKYKTIPQYREHNPGMRLDEFKTIYWWEWTHRLLARLVGAAGSIRRCVRGCGRFSPSVRRSARSAGGWSPRVSPSGLACRNTAWRFT